MDWRWNWFFNILWNAFVHAVSFQWDALRGDGEDLKNWWRSLWDEISNQVSNIYSWVSNGISNIYSWVSDGISNVYSWAQSGFNNVYSWAQSAFSNVYSWAQSGFNNIYSWAQSTFSSVYSWAQGQLNSLRGWAQGYIDYIAGWLKSLFEWIQPYRSLITGWLVQAQNVINWLWHYAWGYLQAFLNDPIGFVLGWLLKPLINLVNTWAAYGSAIIGFITQDLPNLRNLLARGFSLLMRLVDRPAETILELIASVVVDWLAGVVADEW